MSLSVLLGELGDLLRQGKDRIGKIRGLGEAERFRNAELFLLLDRPPKEIDFDGDEPWTG